MRPGPTGSCSCVTGSSSTAPGPRLARSPSSTRPQRSEVASEDTPVASGDAVTSRSGRSPSPAKTSRSSGSPLAAGRFARWWAGWRVAIRIARRDARRYKWRSALIVAMVGLPVLLLTGGITLLATTDVSLAEAVARVMGSAEARIHDNGPRRQVQSPDIQSNRNLSAGALAVPGFASGSDWTTSKVQKLTGGRVIPCLLYTSDAADDLTRVDLGGRRII